jgi:hypothetical protein
MVDTALANNIHLFCLPPHTMHRLQPLDIGVFGPLQKAWFDRCDNIIESTGDVMQTKDVVKEYMVARRLSFKKETIEQGWRRSGIYPLCPGIFSEADFVPSHPTSTIARFPASFPTTMPLAPDASSDDTFDPALYKEECHDSNSNSSVFDSSDEETPDGECHSFPVFEMGFNVQTDAHEDSDVAGPASPTPI